MLLVTSWRFLLIPGCPVRTGRKRRRTSAADLEAASAERDQMRKRARTAGQYSARRSGQYRDTRSGAQLSCSYRLIDFGHTHMYPTDPPRSASSAREIWYDSPILFMPVSLQSLSAVCILTFLQPSEARPQAQALRLPRSYRSHNVGPVNMLQPQPGLVVSCPLYRAA